MEKITLVVRFKIHPGKLDAFKEAAAESLAIVKEKDPATLQYDWCLNGDQTECVLVEAYENSDALLAHMGHVGEPLGKVMAAADMSIELLGDPLPELQQMAQAQGMTVPVYSYMQGLG